MATGAYQHCVVLWVSCLVLMPTQGLGVFNVEKIGVQPIWNATHTDKLRQDLLLSYDKFARPSHHQNKTTIQFYTIIKHIELNEFKSTLTAHLWIRLTWIDEKLKWNPNDYGGIDTVPLADHEIWQPDIFLYNSATATPINHYGDTYCLVYENGEVVWVPPVEVTSLCNFDLRYWPFDTQQCQLKFGSWTYSGDQVDLQVYQNYTSANETLLVQNSEWQLVNTTLGRSELFYDCCPNEPYPNIYMKVYLSRRSAAYRAIIITPAIVVIMLTLLTYWLPPNAGEKIMLNATNVIITSLFLLYFSQKIPAIGDRIPLIILFYSSCLYIVTTSAIGSVIVIWISRTKHTKRLPWIIKKYLTGKMGKILGLNTYIRQTSLMSHRVTAEEMRDHQVTDLEDHTTSDDHQFVQRSKKPPSHQDWILLAATIDRISFLVYSFTFAILAIVYSL